MHEFLQRKPEDEPLDPRWVEIWRKYEVFADRFPPAIIKEISQAIMSVEEEPVIDKEVWGIRVSNDTKVTFLLGAGASAYSGIPTVKQLLPELWNRARKIGREDLENLRRWCDRRQIKNIEDLLTAAYVSDFIAKNRHITALVDYFLYSMGQEVGGEGETFGSIRRIMADVSSIGFLQDTLQTLFGLLTSTMIAAPPNETHKAIVNFIQKHNHTTIITTNYDGCMDEALLTEKITLRGTISGKNEDNPNAVQLIKMHGSINWSYCSSCQDVREFNLLEVKKIFEADTLSYPVLGICKKCGGLRRPLLVPPLSFKFLMFPSLVDIWNYARQSIEEAAVLIIVGYSFSESDAYITKIISRSMATNENQKMIVVDTDASLVPALRGRFDVHIDRFDHGRILKACGTCETVLPRILDSMLANGHGNEQAQ
jgi:NAD-dependent SIR2 family protein deacetylase